MTETTKVQVTRMVVETLEVSIEDLKATEHWSGYADEMARDGGPRWSEATMLRWAAGNWVNQNLPKVLEPAATEGWRRTVVADRHVDLVED